MLMNLDEIESYFIPRFEEDGIAAFDDKTVARVVRDLVARVKECPMWKAVPDATGRWQRWSRIAGGWESQGIFIVSQQNLDAGLYSSSPLEIYYGPFPIRPPE